jgi:hypothetical protein
LRISAGRSILFLLTSFADKIGVHQTFYIDIDEEITSVIERLKKARANEIIIVVPKRALLIQSIVNLRILKKEADEANLQLMIVTQDKLGKILIEKAGILVQQKMENLSDEEINLNENKISQPETSHKVEIEEKKDLKDRLDKIGSENYFTEEEIREKNLKVLENVKNKYEKKVEDNKEKITNKELVTEIGQNIRKKQTTTMDLMAGPLAIQNRGQGNKPEVFPEPAEKIEPKIKPAVAAPVSYSKDPYHQDKKIESFFNPSVLPSGEKPRALPKKNEFSDRQLSRKAYGRFWIFGAIFILFIACISAYLLLPKVTVAITTKAKTQAVDLEVSADTNASSIDYDKGTVPAKIVETDLEVSQNFTPSGGKTTAGQKARGKLTIYNEYSSQPQSLVATTRFLTGDGKMFRLVSAVIVPGMTQNQGQTQAGSVEADVAADQTGENYNISPSKFTIPGFQGSGNDKYTKIYAESKDAMAGGSSGGKTTAAITNQDVASAKSKILSQLNDAIGQKVKDAAGNGQIVPDSAINKQEATYKLSNSIGDAVDSFTVSADMKASAIVASENTLKDLAGKMLSSAGNGQNNIDNSSITLDFGLANADFKAGTMDIKFHAMGKIKPDLNVSKIKTEILGKSEKDLTAYLSTYPDIEKVEMSYWPSFINGRIPFWGQRVNITLDSN